MITVDRAKTILASYGGDCSLWPEQERQAMQALLANSSSLRLLQSEALALDKLISIPVEQQSDLNHYSQLIAQTISTLPDQESTQQTLFFRVKSRIAYFINNWLLPSAFINPVAISAMVLLCALTVFNSYDATEKPSPEYLTLSEFMGLFAEDYAELNDDAYADSDDLETLAFLEPQLFEDNL